VNDTDASWQANLGAKNHAILMPDANKNLAINSIVGAAFGGNSFVFLSSFDTNAFILAAGQRCMAVSVGKHT